MAKQPKVKRLYLGFGDAYVPPVVPPVYVCTYALGLTNGQAISLGATGALTAVDQTVSYTIVGGLGAGVSYYQTTDISDPQTFSTVAGKNVVEFVFTTEAITTAGIANNAVKVINAGTSADVIVIGIDSADGTHSLYVTTNAGGSVYSDAIAVGTNTVGLEMDSATGKIKVKVNGSYITLSDDSYTGAAACILLIAMGETASVDAANADKVFSIAMRTSSSDFTQSYTTGHTDICGNPV